MRAENPAIFPFKKRGEGGGTRGGRKVEKGRN